MTLYLRLGGRAAIDEALFRLRERLSGDPAFKHANFRGELQSRSDFAEFLVFLVGGAPFYDGRPVNELLSPLCDSEDLYDRFAGHIIDALRDFGCSKEDAQELRSLLLRLRPQVLDPKPRKPVAVYSLEPEPLSL